MYICVYAVHCYVVTAIISNECIIAVTLLHYYSYNFIALQYIIVAMYIVLTVAPLESKNCTTAE